MKTNLEKRERRKLVLEVLARNSMRLADYVNYEVNERYKERQEVTDELLEGGFLDEEIDAAFISIKPVERSGDHDADKD